MLDSSSSASPSFETLIVEHLPTLRRRAARMSRSPQDAEDIVHDAVVRALRGRTRMRSAATARGWLLAIVSSTFLDQARRRRVRPLEVALEDKPVVAAPAPAADDEPAWAHLSLDDVGAAVARLPDECRDTFRMFALEGCDYTTIASTLGIPKGTVGSRIARARTQLRALLLAA